MPIKHQLIKTARAKGSKMNSEELKIILEKHQQWLNNEGSGQRANLSDANLSDAYLQGAVGNLKHIKSIFIEQYSIVYTTDYLHIGCERHSINEWWEFNDRRILEMDGKTALAFWRKWKNYIQKTIELSPAESTNAD